jgi:protein phosphatase
MRIEHAARTDLGMKRHNNEDTYLLMAEENLFVAFDGMGGHASGEVAANLAAEVVAEFYDLTRADESAPWPCKPDDALSYDENRLIAAIKLANKRIVQASAHDPKKKHMGTTVVAVQFVEDEEGGPLALVAHVGDSRVYLFRNRKLKRITIDHSLVEEWLRRGKITKDQAKQYEHKNAIIRALGMEKQVEVEMALHQPHEGDTFLLCSDGLSNMVAHEDIEAILRESQTLQEAADWLVDAANTNGGKDNVTAVLAQYHRA